MLVSFLPIIKLAPFHINTRKENGEFFDNEANMFCIQLMPEYYTAHNIRVRKMDVVLSILSRQLPTGISRNFHIAVTHLIYLVARQSSLIMES